MNTRLLPMIVMLATVVGFLAGCKAEKPNESPLATENSSKPMIAFLTFRFYLNEDGKLGISLEETIWSDGNLRDGEGEISDVGYRFAFLDEANAMVGTKYMTDPLNKEVEYVDKDASFKRKKVSLKNELLTMRLMLPRNTKTVEINDQNNNLVAKIDLK